MVTIIIVVLAAILGIGSALYTHKKDGPVEEVCEAIIEKELNLPDGTIELSPEESKPNVDKTSL
jgi:hypothetical protein